MSKTQATTNRTTKPKPAIRARPAATTPPPIASRETIEAVVELMSFDGAHRMPRAVAGELGRAAFLDWHAALIVRAVADAGLPEAAIVRVLIELAYELIAGPISIYSFANEAERLCAKLAKCEALLAGRVDIANSRACYELHGMIYAPEEQESAGSFLCSLVHAAFDLVRNQDEREPGASREIQLAAQHMVRDVFEEKSVAIQIHSELSEHEAMEPAREATEPFVERLRTRLAAALAVHIAPAPTH